MRHIKRQVRRGPRRVNSMSKQAVTDLLADMLALKLGYDQEYEGREAFVMSGPSGLALAIDGQVYQIVIRKVQQSRLELDKA